MQQTIRDELGKGLVKPETRSRYTLVIDELRKRGAAGLILGCTELPLLIKPSETDLPLFDTVSIHTSAIVDFILS